MLIVYAQDKSFKIDNFAFRIGFNDASVKGGSVDTKWLAGFNCGATIDMSVVNYFAIRPGVFYTMKGYNVSDNDIRFNFLEMPILAVFSKDLSNNLNLELQVGPYFAYGIAGKWDTESAQIINNKTEIVKYKKDTFDDFDRFDCGINIGIGLNFNHIHVGATYELGFTNVMNHAHHNCLMVNLGYIF